MKVLVLEACNLLLSTNTAKSNRLTGICLLFTSFKTKALNVLANLRMILTLKMFFHHCMNITY